mmetsp:Transcript_8764/g.13113  ORF Transcript_8764/g.13113 Transcript_8764/m.13113 type:complete len:706 (+) Transcript_8764:82-2199(+)
MRTLTLPLISALHMLLQAPYASSFTVNNPTRTTGMTSSSTPLATASINTSTSLSARTTSEELIPRDVLFGNPLNTSPNLSPDGKYLAYLAPSADGVLNIFVRETADENNDNAHMVTKDTSRGIRQYQWAKDGETILYMQDFEGDENFHLWAIDATATTTSEARDLTPGENVKASNLITNKRFPDEILVGTNERDETIFDMYRVQYKTGERVLDTLNPGDVLGWGTEDTTFQVREALVKSQADSSETVRVRNGIDGEDGEWRDLITFPYGENGNLVDFCNDDGKSCWMTSSMGRETTALLRVDLNTGETLETISSNDKCDVGGVVLDEDTKELRGVFYNYARTEREFLDKTLEEDYDVLFDLGPENCDVSTVSKTSDEKTWVVAYTRSDGPTEFVLYNQEEKTIKSLFVSNPALLEYKFAPMEDIRVTARDGLEMVGYLTRADTEKETPLILLVHGGPWARDGWGFNQQAQWFANRGYATLQMNYRGSTGYGKSFLHKGDGQWGVGDMQHDLTDAVQWAIDEGIADKDNICIYGGSYGGYACLAGLTFTPDLYKCGVDIVGPSNIKTLLDSIPSYWGPLRNDMLKKIGDVDADEEFNRKISPLYHVDKIQSPLLIGQGANDPRVKQAEADQIAFAMKKKGIPVEYVLYPDEGHGFARPDNRIDFNGRAEKFLAKHLGGRAEAFDGVEGATAQFPLLAEEESKVEQA